LNYATTASFIPRLSAWQYLILEEEKKLRGFRNIFLEKLIKELK